MAQQGTVTTIESKPFTDRTTGQPITLWSFQVDTSRVWYRTGTFQPKFQQGDFISFEVGNNNRVDLRNVTTGQAPAGGAPAPAPAARPASGGGTSRDKYWGDKEARDLEKDARYQNVDIPRMSFSAAQDRAVRLVSAALANDCLALGSGKGKRLDILLEQVNEVTNRFFVESMHAHERYAALEAQDPTDEIDAAYGEDELDG